MNCDHCQRGISDTLDAGLDLDADIERHLETCAECRDFHETLLALDAQMASAPRPALPDDFKANLLRALPENSGRLLPGEISALRKQVEREHQQALAALRRRYLFVDPHVLLRLAAIACWVLLGGMALLGVRDLVGSAGTVFGETSRLWAIPVVGGGLGAAGLFFGLSRASRSLPRLRLLQRIVR